MMPQTVSVARGMPAELMSALEGWSLEMRGEMKEEIRALHLEFIRELEIQVELRIESLVSPRRVGQGYG